MLQFRQPRHVTALFSLSLLPLTLGGCPPVVGPTVPASTVEERLASIEKIDQALASIVLDGDPAKTEQVASILRAMPEFAEVEVSGDDVLARFQDGELYVVFNSRPSGVRLNTTVRAKVPDNVATACGRQQPLHASSASVKAVKPDESRRSDSLTGDPEPRVPDSNHAVIVNTLGTDYCDVTPTLAPWLTNAGYIVKQLDGSIEDFRNGVKDVGVFYFSGHGTRFPSRWLKLADLPNGYAEITFQKSNFALWTKVPANAETLGLYKAELQANLITFGRGPNDRKGGSADCLDHSVGTPVPATHLMITDRFIHKYWRCKPGALMYIDACHSAEDGVSPLPAICLNQGADAVNASAFIGWTNTTYDPYSTPTALYFFDRVLGANSVEPIQNPPQRPFPAGEVMQAMKSITRLSLPMDTSTSAKEIFRVFEENPPPPPPPPPASPPEPETQLVESPPTIAKLVASFAPDTTDVLLRPGLRGIAVREGPNPRIVAEGAFGVAQGLIRIEGAGLTIVSWKPNRIEAEISSGATGRVVVESSGRVSPPRRLTQWNLNLRRVFMDYPTQGGADCPSCFWEGNLQYSFRGDTAGVRLLPEGPASPPGFTGGASSGNITVTNAGGTYFIGQGTSITLVPNPDDGAAFIGTCVGFLPTADNNYLGACFFLQGSENRILFSPTLSALGVIRNYHGGVYDGNVEPMQVQYSGNAIGNELELPLSPNFNIAAGQKMTGPNSYFEWDAANATSPAEALDAR